MTYNGSRIPSGEYFDDLLGDHANAGVFNGMGLNDYDRVDQKITPDGVVIRMNCRACNKQADVTVTWEELFYCAMNGPNKPVILPAGWSKSGKNLDCYVHIPCSRCRSDIGGYAPHFTPDEAKNLVQQAVNSGFVNQNQVGAWRQKIQMYQGATG